MKKIFLILLSAIALVGCTIEEKVFSNSDPSTYYQTVPQCMTGLNGCYIPLRSIYANADYFEVCEAAADLIYYKSTSWYDACANYTQAQPRFGSTIWNQCYLGVMRCNAMYAALERAVANQYISEEEADPMFAECVILRAFYYYILTINFGNVPYYFEEVTDANNERISQLPRMSATELRTQLMEQLDEWLLQKQALPKIKTYDPANEYRIGMMVGCVIGGKLAMWNNRFDLAIKFFKPIEDVYAAHATTTNIETGQTEYHPEDALMAYSIKDVMFRNRYTAESIFEIPSYAKDYGFKLTQGLATRCMPSRKTNTTEGGSDDDTLEDESVDMSIRSDIYDGISIPELGDNARVTAQYKPTKYMYYYTSYTDYQGNPVAKGLMPYNSSDKRRSVYDATKIGTEGIHEVEGGGGWLAWCYKGRRVNPVDNKVDMTEEPGMHLFDKLKNAVTGEPHLGDKFWCPGMVYTQDSNNLKIFRFAHVVLDLAEANMRVGNWNAAFAYLNASKKRAGFEILSGGHTDEKLFMQELQEESARELFGEFTRRHNLVRWGIWHDQIAKHATYDVFRQNVLAGPCREYYPIPDVQVVLSNYNLDNKEYDKYGL